MTVDKVIKVKANEFEFNFSGKEILAADIIPLSSNQFSVVKDNQSYIVKILQAEKYLKKQTVSINGEIFEIEINDSLDELLNSMGFENKVSKISKEIKAPMPGLVLDILVSEGDVVKEGDKVLLLGAMKMENSILVQHDAVIKKIHVKKDQAVDKNQLLVEFE